MTTTTHEPLTPILPIPQNSADREEQHIHSVDTARHLGMPMAGALSGAALGALVGAVAGPPGAVTGAVLGTIIGAAAGRGLDVDEARSSRHDGELDDLGVSSENHRAAPLEVAAPEPRRAPDTAWVPDSWPPETGSTNGGRIMQITDVQDPGPNHVQIVRTLNRLIEACVDGEKCLATAAADVRDPAHKRTLHRYSEQRAEFTVALQSAVMRMGASALNEGSTVGAIVRGLESVKVALIGHDDNLILRDCASAELLAAKTYDLAHHALVQAEAPADVRAMVDGQRAEIATTGAQLWRLSRPD
jgi:uncharacterized protein (TIGR02284 family)